MKRVTQETASAAPVAETASVADASSATLETAAEPGPLRWFTLVGGAYPLILPYTPFTRIAPGEELELRETPFLTMQVEASIMSVRD